MNLPEIINLNNLNLLAKGGPVMFILLGFSIFAFSIILVKVIQFSLSRLSKTEGIDKILSKLNGANAKKYLSEIQKIKNQLLLLNFHHSFYR